MPIMIIDYIKSAGYNSLKMPHIRARYALPPLLKKIRYSPVVAMQGVRQCGKSTLARDLLPAELKGAVYRAFDSPSVLDGVMQRPESFLEGLSDHPTVIIDEAQKAPQIFDAIKFRVDQDRRPGQYLLLSSTEFSKLMRIRESLTGRLSRLRLYPMVSGEIAKLSLKDGGPFFLNSSPRISRKDWLLYLRRGGMPAMFATRSDEEWRGKAEDWIALTVERDVHQVPGKKTDSARMMRVLREVVVSADPQASHIAKALRFSPVMVRSYIEILQVLFVIHRIEPHPAGTGKPRYYLCDPGLATALGASFERQLETAFYTEQLAKLSYRSLEGGVQFSYYRSPKGSIIHGVWEQDREVSLLKLFPAETIDERELLILNTTRLKLSSRGEAPAGKSYFLSGSAHKETVNGVIALPWESLG